MKEILDEAREIYEETMHGAAGCCGDLDGAFKHIDEEVGKVVQEIINIAVAGSIDRERADGG